MKPAFRVLLGVVAGMALALGLVVGVALFSAVVHPLLSLPRTVNRTG